MQKKITKIGFIFFMETILLLCGIIIIMLSMGKMRPGYGHNIYRSSTHVV